VANPCTQLAGACVVTDPGAGNVVCIEAWGSEAATLAPPGCGGTNKTWMAGVTCAQALPGGVNTGCEEMVTNGYCSINYYACLATCLTCNASNTTCVVP
jgi:hypothetical protein